MDYIDRIEKELRKRNTTVKKMLEDLEYSHSLINGWKKGSEPSAIKLYKICEYLGVNINYILTGNAVHESDVKLSDEVSRIIKKWEELDEVEREVIEGQIDVIIKVKQKKNKLSG